MKKIGIITATDEEKEAIESVLENKTRKRIYNLDFYEGTILEKECVLVKCGVGKVNAARATQIMIDNYELEYIMNLGTAGTINPMLNVGDVVIGKYVVQHDFDVTAFGHSKGYVPEVGDRVQCNHTLVTKFEKILKKSEERSYQIRIGVIATGDVFCTEITMRDELIAVFDADVVDMECAAIAQVCFLDKIPFVVVRTISDTPNGENADEYEENEKFAAKRCGKILRDFLR